MINVKKWKDTFDVFFEHKGQVFEMFLMHLLLIGAAILFLGFNISIVIFAFSTSALVFGLAVCFIYVVLQTPIALTLNHKISQAPMAKPFSGLLYATGYSAIIYSTLFLISKDNAHWKQLGFALIAGIVMLVILYTIFIGSRLRPGSKNFQCHIQLTWKRYAIFSLGGIMIQNVLFQMMSPQSTMLFNQAYMILSLVIILLTAFIPRLIQKKLPELTQYTMMAYLLILDFVFVVCLIIYFL